MRYPETAALIETARVKKGLSQEKAAHLIGCSRLQWINWEQGRHKPEKFATALVEVIGVDGKKLASADGTGDLDQDALMAPLTRAIRNIVVDQVSRTLRDAVKT